MTEPRYLPCRCKHSKADHSTPGFAPQCTASGCTCLNYRPDESAKAQPAPVNATGSMSAAPTATVQAPTFEQIVAAARRSTHARTVAMADKITADVERLRTRVRTERAAAEAKARATAAKERARQEIAELEAQLKAKRAELRGDRPPPGTTDRPTTRQVSPACPECGKSGLSNLGAHRFRAHGVKAG